MNLEEKFQNTYNLVFRPHHIYGEPKFKTKKCKLKKKILNQNTNSINIDYEYLLFNYILELHERHGYNEVK